MTAETDLLPSSVAAFTEALKGGRGSLDAWLEVNDEREVVAHIEAYARANVAVATATLQAEIEALRAEVGALREELKELITWIPLLSEARAALAKGEQQ